MTRESKFRFWLIALALFMLALWLLRDILLPFVAGMAVAYFLDPLADRLERLGLSRTWATSIITVGFVILLVLGLVLLVPLLQAQIGDFISRVPDYLNRLGERAQPLLERAQNYLSPADVKRLRDSVGNIAGGVFAWSGQVLKNLLLGGMALFNVLSLVFITPVVAFYLLRDWDRIVAKVDSWLPRTHAPTIRAQLAQVNDTLSGFLRGQATVCLVLGTFYGVGLTLVGLDSGLVLGIISGLVSFIPFVGTISGFVIGVLLAIAQSHEWTLPMMVAAVFIVGQVIEGNFLTPKLVGDRVGLHPVWVIFALLAAGSLFGFLGILLAVPVAAVIGVLIRFALARYLSSPLYDTTAGHGPQP